MSSTSDAGFDITPSDPARAAPEEAHLASTAVSRVLVTAGLMVHQLDRILRRSSLTAGSFNVMQVIAASPVPLTPSEISVRIPVPVTTATMTGVLDTLERRGLVARLPHPTDRRRVLVELTQPGTDLLATLVPEVQAAERDWTGPLDADDLVALSCSLDALQAGLRSIPRR